MNLVEKLHELNARPGKVTEKTMARFANRNQLLPRERLSRLLDVGSPFVELQNLANYLAEIPDPDKSVPGASVICGIGFVSGTRCVVYIDDAAINAGAATTKTLAKMLRAVEVALQQKLPFIHLVESSGADLPKYQVETWFSGGAMFAGLARLSAAGIPTFTVLHGPSVAGGAYMPGMSDYVIGVKKNGRAYLAGPALLKAATGEIADDEALGGSEMHASISGLVEYLAEDDSHAIDTLRDLIGRMHWNKNQGREASIESVDPIYNANEILGIVPVDHRIPYDVREVVARIVDGSDFVEFKPLYGSSTLCLHVKIFGYACGIIANNGPIDTDGATKTAQFIQLCDQSDTPIIFLQNITGFMVGTGYEQKGMIKHGSKLLQAVTNARVPRITIQIGASFGAGNYGMCGVGFKPDFIFTWPNAKFGVMGAEQAAKTMYEVMRGGAIRMGVEPDEEVLIRKKSEIIDLFERQSSAFYTSGRMQDDGIIDPRDTRRVLGFVLETCVEARNRNLNPNTFGVARL